MRRKLTALLLILILTAVPAFANDPGPLSEEPLETAPPVNCDCAAALLCEQDSGQVIFCMNPDVERPVASVIKVMTILLTLEALDSGVMSADDLVTVS